MRLGIALLTMAFLAGCSDHSAGTSATQAERHHAATVRVPGTDCVAGWNAAVNRAARGTTLPPLGPYRIGGDGPIVSPSGSYEVFVGMNVSIGLSDVGPRCMVSFRFPHGYRGDLATVYYLEGASGRFTATGIGVRKNALVDGRVYDQRIDGTLYPAPMSAIGYGPPL